MSDALQGSLILLAAYGLGSLPFSSLIVKLAQGIDVRTVGSGNPGATNVLRAAGRGPALLALGLDVSKGVVAVLLAKSWAPAPTWIGWAALAAVCGHVFSPFLGFRGGKGVATAAGALGALMPGALVVAGLVFFATVALTRWVSLGSILGAVAFPIAVWALGRLGKAAASEGNLVLCASLIAVLIVARHRENLKRLARGEESRLGQRRERR